MIRSTKTTDPRTSPYLAEMACGPADVVIGMGPFRYVAHAWTDRGPTGDNAVGKEEPPHAHRCA